LYLRANWRGTTPYAAGVGCAAALTVLLFLPSPRWRRAAFIVLLVVFCFLGVWIIRASPEPAIDVYVIQRAAVNFLLAGLNPCSSIYPDVYEGQSRYYAPGLAQDGWLMSVVGYPPLSLLLALPGHVLLHDFRYSGLAALILSAALMAAVSPGKHSAIAAALFLFTPRVFLVIEQGWTEPFVVLLMAATVYCAKRNSRLLAIVFGLMIGVKQYLLLALSPAVLLLPWPFSWKRYGRFAAVAMLVAAAVAAPFALWDADAFVKSVAGTVMLMPFRLDAISFPAAIARVSGYRTGVWLTLAATLAASVFAVRRAPRTAEGFAAATALLFLAFFACSKTPMLNYYFFVIGTLCCGVAAGPAQSRDTEGGGPQAEHRAASRPKARAQSAADLR
jgi:hypothetical protein